MAKTIEKSEDISFQKYLFHRGENYRSYEFLGAHKAASGKDADGKKTERWTFRVWAPRAKAVSLVGDFNGWNVDSDPMKQLVDDSTIWEITTDKISEGGYYKFAVTSDSGKTVFKSDPYEFMGEKGETEDGGMKASVVWDIRKPFKWHDDAWMKERRMKNVYESPMNIYEVHLGSWRRKEDGSLLSYRELADELIPYVRDMGYTHIETLPVMEYPYEGSWGYQVTGYFAVTSRYGTPDDFRYLIDKAHKAGIGVIMDWVPAHFPKDENGLIEFDGHPLYEDSDPLRMEHKGWGTRAFDFGRPEVLSFLVSDAYYFCRDFHIDGLRVDAVAAMLYLDYDRQDGEWRPNDEGGRENKEAVRFLQKLNSNLLTDFPGVITVAEESTAWPNVTKPPKMGGLGFNFKWNMGWMNDTLEYFSSDPVFRGGMHNKLTFAMTYAMSENYILPISHDEVVHGKKSLLDKMPGEYDDKFAQMRAFLVYMFTHPGKKLNFMGMEIAQFTEWNEKKELDWMLLDYEKHRKMKSFVRELNRFYRETPALWIKDDSYDGFRWIDADNAKDNVFTYYRSENALDPEKPVYVVALNLSGLDFPKYDIGVPDAGTYERVVDTDMIHAGGTGKRRRRSYSVAEGGCNNFAQHITVSLPRFSGIVLVSQGSPAGKKKAVEKRKAAAKQGSASKAETAAEQKKASKPKTDGKPKKDKNTDKKEKKETKRKR
ncbi:MAG: 1,4-alpha-glucan branching protein GlgB [Anaerovoracaceae bacterium]